MIQVQNSLMERGGQGLDVGGWGSRRKGGLLFYA